ncbi:MAG: hypothetical protein JRC68_10150 [Deltaproteobacteria bacterium]|nr:hypothetical protein [Deltaproteobacteria bacterium]
MNFKDEPRFTQIILGMADNSRDEISEEGIAMRFDMLKDFSIEDIEKAAKKILMSRKFKGMPPIAEFYDALHGCDKMQAIDAWGTVMKHLQSGAEPLDPKISEGIRRIGGWDCLTRRTYDELQWDEKRFIEHYESLDEKNMPVLIDGKVVELLDRVGEV